MYVDEALLPDRQARHPTWTHSVLERRTLSDVSRAELVRHGYAVLGRDPREILPAVTDDDVSAAARAELAGCWNRAARRPWWWFTPTIAELGLTSMARGRHAMVTGELMTKTDAVDLVHAPPWLIELLRARRCGEPVDLPRLRTAMIAWRDARRTVAHAKGISPRSRR